MDTSLKTEVHLSIGIIFRDEDGEIMAVGAKRMKGNKDPLMAGTVVVKTTIKMEIDCCF